MLTKPQECCTLPFPCSPRCGQPHRPRRGAEPRGRTRTFPQVRPGEMRRKVGGDILFLHAEETGRGGLPTERGSPHRRRLSSLAGAAGDAGQTAVVGALLARRLPLAAGRWGRRRAVPGPLLRRRGSPCAVPRSPLRPQGRPPRAFLPAHRHAAAAAAGQSAARRAAPRRQGERRRALPRRGLRRQRHPPRLPRPGVPPAAPPAAPAPRPRVHNC